MLGTDTKMNYSHWLDSPGSRYNVCDIAFMGHGKRESVKSLIITVLQATVSTTTTPYDFHIST